MENYFAIDTDIYENEELKHFGILGMHWGIRRFQNPDGTLTAEGRERYGVKTAEETKKLSYSKDYLVLKQKKNRTEKEEQKLKRLEKGKKHFEKSANDPDYWNKLEDDLSVEKFQEAALNYKEYLDSTNYGKGMKEAEVLMAIPTTAVGGAIDVGAIYAQAHLGSPIAFYGLATGLGITVGANIGSDLYAKKHLEALKKELNDSGIKSGYEKTKHIVKDFKSELDDYKNRANDRRSNERVTSVSSAAKKASKEAKEDRVLAALYANPQFFMNEKKEWFFDGKTYGSVDGLIKALSEEYNY